MSKVGYDNCTMLSPDGDLLSYTTNKKGNWYLKKNLAEKVGENPLVIKLLFTPDLSYKLVDFSYFRQVLPSICVVCGCKENLTKHHCIPSCYRQYFPYEYKAHNYHDVLLLCLSCHKSYELHAEDFKKQLRDQHQISLKNPNEKYKRIIYTAQLLLQSLSGKMVLPEHRFQKLAKLITDHLNREPTFTDLVDISNIQLPEINYNPSKAVVDKVDITTFIKEWRKHFVDIMQPKFLPPFWSLDKIYIATPKKKEMRNINE